VQRQVAASSVADTGDKARVEFEHPGVQVAGFLDVTASEGLVSAALGVCTLGQQLYSCCEKQWRVSVCVYSASVQLHSASACAAVGMVDMTHTAAVLAHTVEMYEAVLS
jgi:hypothetical protein